MKTFEEWASAFNNQDQLCDFNKNQEALLWLKVRAITRNQMLPKFAKEHRISLTARGQKEQAKELFGVLCGDLAKSHQWLNGFLGQRKNELYIKQGVDEKKLRQDLDKVENYVWGGDQTNSLDKYLVTHYVKSVSNLDDLLSKKADIDKNAWEYIQNSWYNNWTSFLIESFFKKHSRVVSAVGEIKSVDFFINDYPVDLKVTYFPNEYLQKKLKEAIGKEEVPWLKAKAKSNGISIDSSWTDRDISRLIPEKLSSTLGSHCLDQLANQKRKIVADAQANKRSLMKWLYENQGEMRFGAECLFLTR